MNKNEWILEMTEQAFSALNAERNSQLDTYVSYGGQRIVKYYDASNGSVGIAFCNPDDTFDFKTGVAIAFAKATNQRLHPDFKTYRYTDLRKLEVGDEFYDYSETDKTYKVMSKTLDDETNFLIFTVKDIYENMYDIILAHKNEKCKVMV